MFAPGVSPKRSIACHSASITIVDVKCAFGVEARAESYSSGVRCSLTSRAISCQSLRGYGWKTLASAPQPL